MNDPQKRSRSKSWILEFNECVHRAIRTRFQVQVKTVNPVACELNLTRHSSPTVATRLGDAPRKSGCDIMGSMGTYAKAAWMALSLLAGCAALTQLSSQGAGTNSGGKASFILQKY